MPTKKVITSVSLTPEGKRALVEIAESEGVSVTAIVEQMIRAKARAKKISLKAEERAS